MPDAPTTPLAGQLSDLSASLAYTLPELALATLLLLVLGVGLIWRQRQQAAGWVTLMGLVGVGALVAAQVVGLNATDLASSARPLWGGTFALDAWSVWFKALIVGSALVVTLLLLVHPQPEASEAYVLLLGLTLGAVLMASANHFLIVYLSLALASLSSYVLVALDRADAARAEAALKYLVYGAVSSAVGLYGISLVYGLTGTLQLGPGLALRLAEAPPLAASAALTLISVALAYKLSAAPLHFWAPDAYQGAPLPIATALATVSKLGAVALTLRLADSFRLVAAWPWVLGALALLSLTVGSLGALRQRDYKRLLAYAGVAQAGYLLLGLAVNSDAGVRATLAYALAYVLLTLVAFAAAGAFAQRAGTDDVDAWLGLGRKHPLAAGLLALAMIGLVGLPPTVGFIGKLGLFLPLLQSAQELGPTNPNGLFALVLLGAGLLYTVVSLFFYLKMPARLLLEGEAAQAGRIGSWRLVGLVLGSAAVLYLGTLGAGWLLS